MQDSSNGTPFFFLLLLNVITILQFLLGGVVPAAPDDFQDFIQRTLSIPSTESSFYLGFLETAFLGAYCVSTLIVGFMSKTIPPITLIYCGVMLWTMSAVLCGCAFHWNSFITLLVGRMCTGLSEATFRVLTLPLIEELTPPHTRSRWCGVYFGCICVASGVAYVYGSLTVQALGWNWSFFLCGFAMTPCLVAVWIHLTSPWNVSPTATDNNSPETLSDSIRSIMSNPTYILSVVGLGALNFTIQAMTTFAPAILLGLRTLDERWAASSFGILVVVCGIVGAPLGGMFLDRANRGHELDKLHRNVTALRQSIVLASISMIAGLWTYFVLLFDSLRVWHFFLASFILFSCIFAILGSASISIILSVHEQHRALAMAIALFVQNLVGNVPAPIVMGYIKSLLAPGCGSERDVLENRAQVHQDCYLVENQRGLVWTWIIMVLWMIWTIIFWLPAYYLTKRADKMRRTCSLGGTSDSKEFHEINES